MIIGPMKICEAADLWLWSADRKIYDFNGIQDLVYRDETRNHAKFQDWDFFVITNNYFNPEYQDDADGLRWHPAEQLAVVNTKSASLCVL